MSTLSGLTSWLPAFANKLKASECVKQGAVEESYQLTAMYGRLPANSS